MDNEELSTSRIRQVENTMVVTITPERDYPKSVDDVICEQTYRRSAVRAMRWYKTAKPWTGSLYERIEKLTTLHTKLCRVYGVNVNLFISPCVQNNRNGNGLCTFSKKRKNGTRTSTYIVLTGKLSVLTYLHEFGHALHGPSEMEACRWSLNLFRKVFPDNFERHKENAIGHMLRAHSNKTKV